MSRPRKESHVTDRGLIALSCLEQILLYITNTLHDEPNGEQDYSCNIPTRSKFWLWILCDIWRVQDGNWQRDGPDPEHLEDPESEKWEEFIPHVVEAVVLTCFQYAE